MMHLNLGGLHKSGPTILLSRLKQDVTHDENGGFSKGSHTKNLDS